MNNRRLKKSMRGFTLLEVMVALSILGVTFVVLLGLRNRDILQHYEARNLTRATILAQQKISELEMAGFPPLGLAGGDFEKPDETFSWTQSVVATPLDYAREVRIEVSWNADARRDAVELVTYVMEEK